jgi:hypothetical protein
MNISLNNQEFFTISEIQKNVIKNDINSDNFESEIKRIIKYILTHRYEECFKKLKLEWLPKLKERVDSIPTDDDKLASLIFSQPDYMSMKRREEAEKFKNDLEKSSSFSVY